MVLPSIAVNAENSTASTSTAATVRMQNTVLFQEYNPEAEEIGSYLDRFDCFTLVNGVDESKKAKFFIACVGATVYQKLLLLAIPKKPTDLSFAEVETLLREEYKKQPLTHVARHNFRHRNQQNGESFRTFYNALKELSRDCAFENADVLKEELKGQIISGIRDSKTQSYYFMQPKLTLDDVVKKAEIDEQASDGIQHFKNEHDTWAGNNVNRINEPFTRKKFPSRGGRSGASSRSNGPQLTEPQSSRTASYVCYRCARSGHKADFCYYRSATCNKCKKVGHIAVACGKSREALRRQSPTKVNQVDDTEHYEVVPFESVTDYNFDDYEVETVNAIRDPKKKVFMKQ